MTQMRASEHRKARGGRCGAPGLRSQHWSYAAPLRRFLAPLLVTAGAWCASASNAARSAKVNGTQSTSASDTRVVAVRDARGRVKRCRKRDEHRLLRGVL